MVNHPLGGMLNTLRSLAIGGGALLSLTALAGGIASMRTKHNCKGTPSPSYVGGAKVPDIKFHMASFR